MPFMMATYDNGVETSKEESLKEVDSNDSLIFTPNYLMLDGETSITFLSLPITVTMRLSRIAGWVNGG